MARALGSAGATVYVSGRTVKGGPPPLDGAAGTVDQTAEEVTRRGGTGIAAACDHTDDAQAGPQAQAHVQTGRPRAVKAGMQSRAASMPSQPLPRYASRAPLPGPCAAAGGGPV